MVCVSFTVDALYQKALAEDHRLFFDLALGEALQAAAIEHLVLVPAREPLGVELRDDRRHHEAVADEAAGEIEPGHAGRLAKDRMAVGRDVVGAGPLAQHLQVGEARHQRHHLARQRREELEARAHLDALRVILDGDAGDDFPAHRLREVQARREHAHHRRQKRLERLGREDLVAVRVVRQLDAEHARHFR